jgi:hypothetical protein
VVTITAIDNLNHGNFISQHRCFLLGESKNKFEPFDAGDAVQFLEMSDLGLTRGANMDEQDRQDGVQVSFQSMIVGEFSATLLVEERPHTRTK